MDRIGAKAPHRSDIRRACRSGDTCGHYSRAHSLIASPARIAGQLAPGSRVPVLLG
jgi:hypothetical protein